jgi:hypothetical protein
VYRIGGRGPGGGIVFYDKGVFSNGWQYLEAAPSDIGRAEWGLYRRTVGGTMVGVGSGKRNTELIVAALRRNRETNRAAQLCAAYDANGYRDWYLPSQDELDLMYKNLAARGLGGFDTDYYSDFSRYWSSSEEDRKLAYFQNFARDSHYGMDKNETYSVRPIRAF